MEKMFLQGTNGSVTVYDDIVVIKRDGLLAKLTQGFFVGEKEINRIEKEEKNLAKYKTLMRLYDQAEIINDLV